MIRNLPLNTTAAVRLEKLIRPDGKRPLSERLSSRLVRCAAVLAPGEFVGWQMTVPTKGLVGMTVFGAAGLEQSDLDWIAEKTGETAPAEAAPDAPEGLGELAELVIPAAGVGEPVIGFGAEAGRADDAFSGWPAYFPGQFAELVRALQATGAVFRAVIGPADERERQLCRKSVLRTYDVRNIDAAEYIGCPVRSRFLLRLPQKPGVRLLAVLSSALPAARLVHLGAMSDPSVAAIWAQPLSGAPVLPDLAVRFLMLEPELQESVIGVEVCEEHMKKLPASHKSTKAARAVTIGHATDTAGIRRKITIGELDLRRHYQIVGQTGTGKSTLLASLILSAIEQGHGLTFFDPHGTTVDTVLRALPEQYAGRVRVVRIGDADNPVPINIWDSDDFEKEERNINDLCELFGDLFNPPGEVFVGPRYERWLSTFARASIAFLGRRASLESIAVISQSQDNMLKVSKAIYSRYPQLVETIKQEYGLDNSSDFHATLSWYLCKFQRLTAVEQLRKTLGAGANALDFANTIDSDTVTLIDLASPTIGTHAARIVGTLLLMKIWNAAMARRERERTHLVVVDEASLFQTNPMPRMLAESRKFGLAMVLSHQHTGQLSAEIRDALEANSANFSAFRLSPRDAATAAVRFDDEEMRVHLARLDAFHAVTTLSVDGRQTAPFTLEIDRVKPRRNGEKTAAAIERRSIETLVEPYRRLRALAPAEIQKLLDHPEKREPENPDWLEDFKRKKAAQKTQKKPAGKAS